MPPKQRETTIVRVSNVFKEIISSFTNDEQKFIEAADEVAVSYKYFQKHDINLLPRYESAYQSNKKKVPRLAFEALTGITNYINEIRNRETKFDLQQCDRWMIITFYILSRVYLKSLNSNSFNDKEKKRLIESEICAQFLFSDKLQDFEAIVDKIIIDLDPFKFSYFGTHTWIIAICMNSQELGTLLSDPQVLNREKMLQELLSETLENITLKISSSLDSQIKTFGFNNKLLEILLHKENANIYIDEQFLSDIVSLFHYICLHERNFSFNPQSIQTLFMITGEIVKTMAFDQSKERYYMSNMINDGANDLPEAIETSLTVLTKKEFLISPEMWLRTPFQIITEANSTHKPFMRNEVIKTILDRNIIHLVLPVYKYLVQINGKIVDNPISDKLGFRITSKSNTVGISCYYDQDKNQLSLYISLLLDQTQISFELSFEAFEILSSYLHNGYTEYIKLKEGIAIKNLNGSLSLSYNGVSIILSTSVQDDFIEVLDIFKNHEKYLMIKEFSELHYGRY